MAKPRATNKKVKINGCKKVTTTKNKNELNLKAQACRQEIKIRSYATSVKKSKPQGQDLRPIQEVEV